MSAQGPRELWTVDGVMSAEDVETVRRLQEGRGPFAVAVFAEPVTPADVDRLLSAHGLVGDWAGTVEGRGAPYYPGDIVYTSPATLGMVVRHADGTETPLPDPPTPPGELLPPVEP